MGRDMHTNIDHDIFRKKEESRRLDIQVRWFLRKQKRKEAAQIEFGRSLHVESCQAKGINPYKFSLENRMQSDIAKAHAEHAKKAKPQPPQCASDIQTESDRKKFNRAERSKAWKSKQKEFSGVCAKHGQQVFKIKGDGDEHICSICRSENSTKQNNKRRKVAA